MQEGYFYEKWVSVISWSVGLCNTPYHFVNRSWQFDPIKTENKNNQFFAQINFSSILVPTHSYLGTKLIHKIRVDEVVIAISWEEKLFRTPHECLQSKWNLAQICKPSKSTFWTDKWFLMRLIHVRWLILSIFMKILIFLITWSLFVTLKFVMIYPIFILKLICSQNQLIVFFFENNIGTYFLL